MQIKTKIDGIKNYDWIPSVTWLLSLLVFDSFKQLEKLPNFANILKEAWIRGTYVHKFIEDDLNWKLPRVVKKHRDFIKQYIIYKNSINVMRNYKLEQKLIVKDFWGTIDYIEDKNDRYVDIIDWKTSSTMNPNPELIEKYKLQMWGYNLLVQEKIKKSVGQGKIVIFTPKWTKVITMNSGELAGYSDYFENIINYYKYIKKGITPDNLYICREIVLPECSVRHSDDFMTWLNNTDFNRGIDSSPQRFSYSGAMPDSMPEQNTNNERIYVDNQSWEESSIDRLFGEWIPDQLEESRRSLQSSTNDYISEQANRT